MTRENSNLFITLFNVGKLKELIATKNQPLNNNKRKTKIKNKKKPRIKRRQDKKTTLKNNNNKNKMNIHSYMSF